MFVVVRVVVCVLHGIAQVLNARVYDVAIDSPLQKAVNMSNELDNEIFFKVSLTSTV